MYGEFITLLKETYRSFVCPCADYWGIVWVVSSSVDFLLMGESAGGFDSWCGHIIGVVTEVAQGGEGDLRDVNVFCLCFAGWVWSVEALVDCLWVGLLYEGQPLEGEGGPLEFVDEESIVEKASVFHPYEMGVVVLVRLDLHGANWLCYIK
jgi:hypothetical protein